MLTNFYAYDPVKYVEVIEEEEDLSLEIEASDVLIPLREKLNE